VKKTIAIVGFVFLVAGVFSVFIFQRKQPESVQSNQDKNQAVAVMAENLVVPWSIVFLPDTKILVAERSGIIRQIDENGNYKNDPFATISDVKEIGEGGLLGMVLHPDFIQNKYIYLYYTYNGEGEETLNRVVRMKYQDDKLYNQEILLDNIPGASNHNGGRIKFGPDRLLYITTGDAQNPSQAQDKTSLAGKILRVTDEGKVPDGNPFGNPVYSYGHRNPQGLDWDMSGRLWATEHGRSGVVSGLDELNYIEIGKNYGWPVIEGEESRQGMVSPILNSGSTVTWAPSGAAFYGKSLFFAGLRGKALYEAVFEDSGVRIREHLKNKYGRIREVALGPDNLLYITTSNRDGRGIPSVSDDKILVVDPSKL